MPLSASINMVSALLSKNAKHTVAIKNAHDVAVAAHDDLIVDITADEKKKKESEHKALAVREIVTICKDAKREWTPDCWQSKPIKQAVTYDDPKAFEGALTKLKNLPPLVTPHEIHRLREKLEQVALGKAFLLQGGDCAELFDYCSPDQIDLKIKLLLQMSLVIMSHVKTPVVRIARIAGQYAKPRSSLTEVVDGKEIHSFRGDNINGYLPHQRTPDPWRLVNSYFHSAAVLNYIRTQLTSGLADLHSPPYEWSLSHVQSSEVKAKYQAIVESIRRGLEFVSVTDDDKSSTFRTADIYTSHEGLILEYEQSLTRYLKDPKSSHTHPTKKWYNTSAHFLWIGDRTRQLDGAHVEYFRGIENPIGIKIGPSIPSEDIVPLLDIINPDRLIGKVVLITRYGAEKIEKCLPGHIKAVQASKHNGKVVWQCDPMHGNTYTSPATKQKTRNFQKIMSEIHSCLQIHRSLGSRMGGIHLEMTGDAVTECVGGSEGLKDEDLGRNYKTYCDPRLNAHQALDAAFLLADWLKGSDGRRNSMTTSGL